MCEKDEWILLSRLGGLSAWGDRGSPKGCRAFAILQPKYAFGNLPGILVDRTLHNVSHETFSDPTQLALAGEGRGQYPNGLCKRLLSLTLQCRLLHYPLADARQENGH